MGLKLNLLKVSVKAVRYYGARACQNDLRCRVLVVGGGAGGCSMAWRFSRKLGNDGVIVVEPSQVHYYQPLFPLVAAGIKKFSASMRQQKSVLPPGVRWIQDHVVEFDPCGSYVYTSAGNKIHYDFMIVAVGLVNDYDEIPGLKAALDDCSSGVSTIYDPAYCVKTWSCITALRGGHGVFTFPRAGGKCSGAAQNIMYLAEDYWWRKKLRNLISITYNTGGSSLFGVDKYRTALERVVERKRIAVNYNQELQELRPRVAVFADTEGRQITAPFNFLHVTPPMSPPKVLRSSEVVGPGGYLDVDPGTLQHRSFTNVFGVGDCLCTPNSKTAAAVARQSLVVERNLTAVMFGKTPPARYDGYGACPLLTDYSHGILAESVYGKKPCETFPIDQSKERRLFYYVKTHLMSYIYWNKLIKGKFDGPEKIRRILNPFGK